MKNLLGKVPEDSMLLQTNSENKFLGTFMWKIFDAITFGKFEHKTPEVKKGPENDDNHNPEKLTNSTPLEIPFDDKTLQVQ